MEEMELQNSALKYTSVNDVIIHSYEEILSHETDSKLDSEDEQEVGASSIIHGACKGTNALIKSRMLYKQINRYRKSKGKDAVEWNNELKRKAKKLAEALSCGLRPEEIGVKNKWELVYPMTLRTVDFLLL